MEEKIYIPRKYKNKKEITISIIVVIVITIAILIIGGMIKKAKYHKTYEYKLLQLGYTKEQVKTLLDYQDLDLDYVLSIDKNDNLITILNAKYYLKKNLTKYVNYQKENTDKSIDDIIAIINTHNDDKYYENELASNKDKDLKILVNKHYHVDGEYEPEDLVKISNWYSYGDDQMMREEAYNEFISMFNAAKDADIKIIINSSYRSYADQKATYDDYLQRYGLETTEALAAHPGNSEHQTGLAIDVTTPGYNTKTFDQSDAYTWLSNNAYKYGYILRYPKDKEYLTGFDYESWHYRYVGKEIAKYIHENNITYDEYYAYFEENEK